MGVSKASTLARLAKEWGIDSCDVVAFGDMPNDLEMLKWAGVGYAMANAHGEVLAATAHVAPAIHDDGVAEVLDAVFADFGGRLVDAGRQRVTSRSGVHRMLRLNRTEQ